MKHQTIHHVKTKRLARALQVRRYAVVGILDLLWLCARETYPTGLLPFSEEELAEEVDWEGDPSHLARALIDSGWLHRIEGGFGIHDWQDHCEDTVHRKLAGSGTLFWNGEEPKLSKLPKKDRPAAEARLRDAAHDSAPPAPVSAPPAPEIEAPAPVGAARAPNGAHGRPRAPTTPHLTTPHLTNTSTPSAAPRSAPARGPDRGGGGGEARRPDPPPEPDRTVRTDVDRSLPQSYQEHHLRDRATVDAMVRRHVKDPTPVDFEGAWRTALFALRDRSIHSPIGYWRKCAAKRQWTREGQVPNDPEAGARAMAKRSRERLDRYERRSAEAVSREETSRRVAETLASLSTGPVVRASRRAEQRERAPWRLETERDREQVEARKAELRAQLRGPVAVAS